MQAFIKKSISQSFYTATGIVGKKSDDVYLSSFPKSGNTWVRFYLCNLINQIPEYHFTDAPIGFDMLNSKMIELGSDNLLKQWPFKGFPRLIKTHLAYNALLIGKQKSILVMRDPKDVMVSFYKYETTKTDNFYRRFKETNFAAFIRHPKFGIESWCKHYVSWQPNANLVIKYENIKADDRKVFSELNKFLGITVLPEIFDKALALSRFDNIKRIEAKDGSVKAGKFGDAFKFTRSGKTGQWKDLFSEKDIEYLNATLKKYSITLY